MDYENLAEEIYLVYKEAFGVADDFYDLSPCQRKAWIAAAKRGYQLSVYHMKDQISEIDF